MGEAADSDRWAGPALARLKEGDNIERCVATLFEERLREARQGGVAARWPERFSAELDRLVEPFERYKTELLVEHSLVLSPFVSIDPANRYWNHHRGDPLLLRSERTRLSFLSPADLAAAFDANKPIPETTFWREALPGAALLGFDAVMSAHDRLKAVWPLVHDSLSANSHFSVRVVDYVHGLLFAIAETVHPLIPG